jgi:hypothetical protein
VKYKNKKLKKIILSMGEGDQNKDPYERIQKILNRRLELFSRGGKRERSHKKRVGNIVNKDINNRYNMAYKVIKNITIKEDAENFENMTAKNICLEEKNWENFDYNKGLDALIEKDKTGYYIYIAGRTWKQFDYDKGLDGLAEKDKASEHIYYAGLKWDEFDYNKGLESLIEKSKTGEWIFQAGKNWESFDYNKGFKGLIEKDKNGEYIYHAGLDWEHFDYNKALKALEGTEYYKEALNNWPKGLKDTRKEIERLRKTSTELKGKKLKLR